MDDDALGFFTLDGDHSHLSDPKQEEIENISEEILISEEEIDSDENELLEVLEALIPHLEYINYEAQASHPYCNNRKLKQEIQCKLEVWEAVLTNDANEEESIRFSYEQSISYKSLYYRNLSHVISEIKELESAYHATQVFFENSGKAESVHFLNASLHQITNLDNTVFFDCVKEILLSNFDRLDLSESYSLLVIPGYLKSSTILEKWAKLAYGNKVQLVTDFLNLETPLDVVELFENENLTGFEAFRSNTVMVCNWLIARGKYNLINEGEPLYSSPAMALAGRMYQNIISQASAGDTFGVLKGFKGVHFKLLKSDISILDKLGVIPINQQNNAFFACTNKTLFQGTNLGLKNYNFVRVFDYLTKVLIDFFNRRTFENFNARIRKELTQQVVDFLDECTGADRLIESFVINRFEQDPKNKNMIHLDLKVEPFFPSRNFVIKLDFDSTQKKWNTELDEVT